MSTELSPKDLAKELTDALAVTPCPDLSLVEKLLAAGADPNAPRFCMESCHGPACSDTCRRSALAYIISRYHQLPGDENNRSHVLLKIVKALIGAGAKILPGETSDCRSVSYQYYIDEPNAHVTKELMTIVDNLVKIASNSSASNSSASS
jgi:hypothetical protein